MIAVNPPNRKDVGENGRSHFLKIRRLLVWHAKKISKKNANACFYGLNKARPDCYN